MKSVRIPVTGGGWATLDASEEGIPGLVYVRLTEVDGRLRVTELYVDGRGMPIQQGALRYFPLGQLEDWLADGQNGATLRRSLLYPEIDLSTEARGTRWKNRGRAGGAGVPQAKVFELAGRPDSLTDAFLGDVAKAYRSAVARHLPPAVELARQAGEGTSLRTAQGWIYKARKRGLLEPAKHRGRIA